MPAVLQSHQRQHNKDKPYKCPNCYRAYTDSASLQIHLSAHAIKHAKAYCCSMCGRAYTSVSGAVGSTRAMGGHGPPTLPLTLSVCPAGDLFDEAHVQTYRGGAPREPALTSKDGVPRHPRANLTHLSRLCPLAALPPGSTAVGGPAEAVVPRPDPSLRTPLPTEQPWQLGGEPVVAATLWKRARAPGPAPGAAGLVTSKDSFRAL